MPKLQPISEETAQGDTSTIYQSIRKTLGLSSVPLVFQYFAYFPLYLSYVWNQALPNLEDSNFQRYVRNLEEFSREAISGIYIPQAATEVFLDKLRETAVKQELLTFADMLSRTNAELYLLSLALRESLKGTYLGIKQIGSTIAHEDKSMFQDLSEGFIPDTPAKNPERPDTIQTSSKVLVRQQPRGLINTHMKEFFTLMDWEMRALMKQENYLTRRVALEKLALSYLPLLPHPLESSFKSIVLKTSEDPLFPELLYLVAELFPTQSVYKLLAAGVMKKTLKYSETDNTQLSLRDKTRK